MNTPMPKIHEKCPACNSGNYNWKAVANVEFDVLVVSCLKCLYQFLTTREIFSKRSNASTPAKSREPGEEG